MKALEQAGYKLWKTDSDQYGFTQRWQARLDTQDWFDYPVCQFNDKLFINVELYDFDVNGVYSQSASIYLVHENEAGEWCDIKIYSLTWNELESKLQSLEKKLLNMWAEFNQ